jgi:hypothetical protein
MIGRFELRINRMLMAFIESGHEEKAKIGKFEIRK